MRLHAALRGSVSAQLHCVRACAACTVPGRYSGADLAGLVREAAMQALRRAHSVDASTGPLCISRDDFTAARAKVLPSVSLEDELVYRGKG